MLSDYTSELSRHFKFTSSYTTGSVFSPGIFLGKDSEEIIILTEEEFELHAITSNWENLSPIRFLKHPKSDMTLNLPMGEEYSDEQGLSVILINLPMLGIMYHLWRKRELLENSDNPRTTRQFIAGYLLPNSLRSFLDVAYLNMFIKIFNGEEIKEAKDNHPFYMNTYQSNLINSVKTVLHTYLDKNLPFKEVIEAIEGVLASSIRQVMEIPQMPFTRQVNWALTLSRLELIAMLLLWNERTNTYQNKMEINTITKSLRRLRSDKGLEQMGSSELAKYVRNFLKEEIEEYL
ncbi:MAG: hypothetical protein IBX57_00145 [Gammaproteobacteria bacterium]|nr:hypothetical protein [Gammaproteobacteria bacterium]